MGNHPGRPHGSKRSRESVTRSEEPTAGRGESSPASQRSFSLTSSSKKKRHVSGSATLDRRPASATAVDKADGRRRIAASSTSLTAGPVQQLPQISATLQSSTSEPAVDYDAERVVLGSPGQPRILSRWFGGPEEAAQYSHVSEHALIVTWDPPSTATRNTVYQVEASYPDGLAWVQAAEPVVGVTSQQVNDLTPGQTYMFRVTASNRRGTSTPSVPSEPILLSSRHKNGKEVAQFLTKLRDKRCRENSQVEFFVRFRGNPTPRLQWKLNGRPLLNDERVKITDGDFDGRMAISSVKVTDSGRISCSAVNIVGSDTTECELTVTACPKLRLHDDLSTGELKVPLGGLARARVFVDGAPPPECTWFFDQKPLDSADKRISWESSTSEASMQISHVNRQDAGSYRLRAVNSVGSDSVGFNITVIDAPGRPSKPKITCFTATSASIAWQPPASTKDGETVLHYLVEYLEDGWSDWKLAVSADSTSALVSGLTAGCRVKFRVKAAGAHGAGLASVETGALTLPVVDPAHFRREISTTPEVASAALSKQILLSPASNSSLQKIGSDVRQGGNPVISAVNSSVTCTAGSTVCLYVRLHAPVESVVWHNGDTPLPENNEHHRIESTRLADGSGTSQVRIARPTENDSGVYTAIASTSQQSDQGLSASIVLQVRSPEMTTQDIRPLSIVKSRSVDETLTKDLGQPPSALHRSVSTCVAASQTTEDRPLACSAVGKLAAAAASLAAAPTRTKTDASTSSPDSHFLHPNQQQMDERMQRVSRFLRRRNSSVFHRTLEDTVCATGGVVNLVVEMASGYGDNQVKWYHNGAVIGESSRHRISAEGNLRCLQITNVTGHDVGRWCCALPDITGTPTTTALLRVQSSMSSGVILEPSASIESLTASLPSGLQYSIVDSPQLSRRSQTPRQSDCGSISRPEAKSMKYIGQQPPLVEDSLYDRKVRVGDVLEFSVTVCEPHCVRSLVWLHKDKPVVADGRHEFESVPGSGICRLVVKPTQLSDDSQWKLVLTSDRGQTETWCNVTLAVPRNYRRPHFMETLRALLSDEGLVSFECKVAGYPAPQLRWFKDGQELRPGDVYQLSGTNSLGLYACVAHNCMGTIESTAELTMSDIDHQLTSEQRLRVRTNQRVPPKFVNQLPLESIVKLGQSHSIVAEVTSYLDPTVQWFHNGTPIESCGSVEIHRASPGVYRLDFQPAKFTHQGEWRCVATNAAGSVETSTRLILETPKHFRAPYFLQPLRATLTDSGAVDIECKVLGTPQPVLHWYKDGRELKAGDIQRITSGDDSSESVFGVYTCEAVNCMGSTCSSATLSELECYDTDQRYLLTTRPDLPPHVEHYGMLRDLSLSTINEERTSQLVSPVDSDGAQSSCVNPSEMSVTVDGCEIAVSVYGSDQLSHQEVQQVMSVYGSAAVDSRTVPVYGVCEEKSSTNEEVASDEEPKSYPSLRVVQDQDVRSGLNISATIIDLAMEVASSVANDDTKTEVGLDELELERPVNSPDQQIFAAETSPKESYVSNEERKQDKSITSDTDMSFISSLDSFHTADAMEISAGSDDPTSGQVTPVCNEHTVEECTDRNMASCGEHEVLDHVLTQLQDALVEFEPPTPKRSLLMRTYSSTECPPIMEEDEENSAVEADNNDIHRAASTEEAQGTPQWEATTTSCRQRPLMLTPSGSLQSDTDEVPVATVSVISKTVGSSSTEEQPVAQAVVALLHAVITNERLPNEFMSEIGRDLRPASAPSNVSSEKDSQRAEKVLAVLTAAFHGNFNISPCVIEEIEQLLSPEHAEEQMTAEARMTAQWIISAMEIASMGAAFTFPQITFHLERSLSSYEERLTARNIADIFNRLNIRDIPQNERSTLFELRHGQEYSDEEIPLEEVLEDVSSISSGTYAEERSYSSEMKSTAQQLLTVLHAAGVSDCCSDGRLSSIRSLSSEEFERITPVEEALQSLMCIARSVTEDSTVSSENLLEMERCLVSPSMADQGSVTPEPNISVDQVFSLLCPLVCNLVMPYAERSVDWNYDSAQELAAEAQTAVAQDVANHMAQTLRAAIVQKSGASHEEFKPRDHRKSKEIETRHMSESESGEFIKEGNTTRNEDVLISSKKTEPQDYSEKTLTESCIASPEIVDTKLFKSHSLDHAKPISPTDGKLKNIECLIRRVESKQISLDVADPIKTNYLMEHVITSEENLSTKSTESIVTVASMQRAQNSFELADDLAPGFSDDHMNILRCLSDIELILCSSIDDSYVVLPNDAFCTLTSVSNDLVDCLEKCMPSGELHRINVFLGRMRNALKDYTVISEDMVNAGNEAKIDELAQKKRFIISNVKVTFERLKHISTALSKVPHLSQSASKSDSHTDDNWENFLAELDKAATIFADFTRFKMNLIGEYDSNTQLHYVEPCQASVADLRLAIEEALDNPMNTSRMYEKCVSSVQQGLASVVVSICESVAVQSSLKTESMNALTQINGDLSRMTEATNLHISLASQSKSEEMRLAVQIVCGLRKNDVISHMRILEQSINVCVKNISALRHNPDKGLNLFLTSTEAIRHNCSDVITLLEVSEKQKQIMQDIAKGMSKISQETSDVSIKTKSTVDNMCRLLSSNVHTEVENVSASLRSDMKQLEAAFGRLEQKLLNSVAVTTQNKECISKNFSSVKNNLRKHVDILLQQGPNCCSDKEVYAAKAQSLLPFVKNLIQDIRILLANNEPKNHLQPVYDSCDKLNHIIHTINETVIVRSHDTEATDKPLLLTENTGDSKMTNAPVSDLGMMSSELHVLVNDLVVEVTKTSRLWQPDLAVAASLRVSKVVRRYIQDVSLHYRTEFPDEKIRSISKEFDKLNSALRKVGNELDRPSDHDALTQKVQNNLEISGSVFQQAIQNMTILIEECAGPTMCIRRLIDVQLYNVKVALEKLISAVEQVVKACTSAQSDNFASSQESSPSVCSEDDIRKHVKLYCECISLLTNCAKQILTGQFEDGKAQVLEKVVNIKASLQSLVQCVYLARPSNDVMKDYEKELSEQIVFLSSSISLESVSCIEPDLFKNEDNLTASCSMNIGNLEKVVNELSCAQLCSAENVISVLRRNSEAFNSNLKQVVECIDAVLNRRAKSTNTSSITPSKSSNTASILEACNNLETHLNAFLPLAEHSSGPLAEVICQQTEGVYEAAMALLIAMKVRHSAEFSEELNECCAAMRRNLEPLSSIMCECSSELINSDEIQFAMKDVKECFKQLLAGCRSNASDSQYISSKAIVSNLVNLNQALVLLAKSCNYAAQQTLTKHETANQKSEMSSICQKNQPFSPPHQTLLNMLNFVTDFSSEEKIARYVTEDTTQHEVAELFADLKSLSSDVCRKNALLITENELLSVNDKANALKQNLLDFAQDPNTILLNEVKKSVKCLSKIVLPACDVQHIPDTIHREEVSNTMAEFTPCNITLVCQKFNGNVDEFLEALNDVLSTKSLEGTLVKCSGKIRSNLDEFKDMSHSNIPPSGAGSPFNQIADVLDKLACSVEKSSQTLDDTVPLDNCVLEELVAPAIMQVSSCIHNLKESLEKFSLSMRDSKPDHFSAIGYRHIESVSEAARSTSQAAAGVNRAIAEAAAKSQAAKSPKLTHKTSERHVPTQKTSGAETVVESSEEQGRDLQSTPENVLNIITSIGSLKLLQKFASDVVDMSGKIARLASVLDSSECSDSSEYERYVMRLEENRLMCSELHSEVDSMCRSVHEWANACTTTDADARDVLSSERFRSIHDKIDALSSWLSSIGEAYPSQMRRLQSMESIVESMKDQLDKLSYINSEENDILLRTHGSENLLAPDESEFAARAKSIYDIVSAELEEANANEPSSVESTLLLELPSLMDVLLGSADKEIPISSKQSPGEWSPLETIIEDEVGETEMKLSADEAEITYTEQEYQIQSSDKLGSTSQEKRQRDDKILDNDEATKRSKYSSKLILEARTSVQGELADSSSSHSTLEDDNFKSTSTPFIAPNRSLIACDDNVVRSTSRRVALLEDAVDYDTLFVDGKLSDEGTSKINEFKKCMVDFTELMIKAISREPVTIKEVQTLADNVKTSFNAVSLSKKQHEPSCQRFSDNPMEEEFGILVDKLQDLIRGFRGTKFPTQIQKNRMDTITEPSVQCVLRNADSFKSDINDIFAMLKLCKLSDFPEIIHKSKLSLSHQLNLLSTSIGQVLSTRQNALTFMREMEPKLIATEKVLDLQKALADTLNDVNAVMLHRVPAGEEMLAVRATSGRRLVSKLAAALISLTGDKNSAEIMQQQLQSVFSDIVQKACDASQKMTDLTYDELSPLHEEYKSAACQLRKHTESMPIVFDELAASLEADSTESCGSQLKEAVEYLSKHTVDLSDIIKNLVRAQQNASASYDGVEVKNTIIISVDFFAQEIRPFIQSVQINQSSDAAKLVNVVDEQIGLIEDTAQGLVDKLNVLHLPTNNATEHAHLLVMVTELKNAADEISRCNKHLIGLLHKIPEGLSVSSVCNVESVCKAMHLLIDAMTSRSKLNLSAGGADIQKTCELLEEAMHNVMIETRANIQVAENKNEIDMNTHTKRHSTDSSAKKPVDDRDLAQKVMEISERTVDMLEGDICKSTLVDDESKNDLSGDTRKESDKELDSVDGSPMSDHSRSSSVYDSNGMNVHDQQKQDSAYTKQKAEYAGDIDKNRDYAYLKETTTNEESCPKPADKVKTQDSRETDSENQITKTGESDKKRRSSLKSTKKKKVPSESVLNSSKNHAASCSFNLQHASVVENKDNVDKMVWSTVDELKVEETGVIVEKLPKSQPEKDHTIKPGEVFRSATPQTGYAENFPIEHDFVVSTGVDKLVREKDENRHDISDNLPSKSLIEEISDKNHKAEDNVLSDSVVKQIESTRQDSVNIEKKKTKKSSSKSKSSKPSSRRNSEVIDISDTVTQKDDPKSNNKIQDADGDESCDVNNSAKPPRKEQLTAEKKVKISEANKSSDDPDTQSEKVARSEDNETKEGKTRLLSSAQSRVSCAEEPTETNTFNWTVKLSNQRTEEGCSLTLRACYVCDTPEQARVQWKHESNELTPGGKLSRRSSFVNTICPDTNSQSVELQVRKVKICDRGEYCCEVIHPQHGRLRCSAQVVIDPGHSVIDPETASVISTVSSRPTPPSFTSALKVSYSLSEDTMTVQCSLSGHPTPQVTWQRDNKLLPKSTRFCAAFDIISGLCELRVRSPRETDSGRYSCEAVNIVDRAIVTQHISVPPRRLSCSPETEVIGTSKRSAMKARAPQFLEHLRDVAIDVGAEISLTAKVDECSRCFYDGVRLDRRNIHSLRDSPTGCYPCNKHGFFCSLSGRSAVCSNHAGYPLAWRRLGVKRPCIVFISRQSSLESPVVKFYQANTFTTRVSSDFYSSLARKFERKIGWPTPEINWLFNQRPLADNSRTRAWSQAPDCGLCVTQASHQDSGRYTCHALNSAGSVQSSCHIAVGDALDESVVKIVDKPEDMIYVVKGDTVILTCRVVGHPRPTVGLFKGRNDLLAKHQCRLVEDGEMYELQMCASQYSDSGTYCIHAANQFSQDRCYILIRVKEPGRAQTPDCHTKSAARLMAGTELTNTNRYNRDVPGALSRAPQARDVGTDWVSLHWGRPTDNGGAPVLSYRVDTWLVNDAAMWNTVATSLICSTDVYGLKSNRRYIFRVTPRNRYGWGEPACTDQVLVGGARKAPVFTRPLAPIVKALLGGSLVLECQVDCEPKAEVVWYHEGVCIACSPSSVGSITSSTASTSVSGSCHRPRRRMRASCSMDGVHQLSIGQLRHSDAGTYTCEASSAAGNGNSCSRLEVVDRQLLLQADETISRALGAIMACEPEEGMGQADSALAQMAPFFLIRPRHRRAEAGCSVRLTCQVTAQPTPEVSWSKGGATIESSGRFVVGVEESDFYTLEIQPLRYEDFGEYSVTASNCYGQVTCYMYLVVDQGLRQYRAPVLLQPLSDPAQLDSRGNVTLVTRAVAEPSLAVLWHCNGGRLRLSRDQLAEMWLSDRGEATLKLLAPLTAAAAGCTFSCTLSNEAGHVTTSCKLPPTADKSSSSPVFVKSPVSSHVREEDPVTISCEVSGQPRPDVYWCRADEIEGSEITVPSTARELSWLEGNSYSLRLSKVTRQKHNRRFAVIARNIHGSAVSHVTLSVSGSDSSDERPAQSEAVFVEELRHLRCCNGDSVALQAQVNTSVLGNPASPTVSWHKDGQLLETSSDEKATYSARYCPASGVVSLRIARVLAGDQGQYVCSVSFGPPSNSASAETHACLIVDAAENHAHIVKMMSGRDDGPPPASIRLGTTSPPPLASRSKIRDFLPSTSTMTNVAPTCRTSLNVGYLSSTRARAVSEQPSSSHTHTGSCVSSPLRRTRRIVEAPRFLFTPHDTTAQEGDTVTLRCTVSGDPSPSTDWSFDALNIRNTDKYRVTDHGEERSLTVHNVRSTDAGLYRVTAHNSAGRQHACCRLIVLAKPSAMRPYLRPSDVGTSSRRHTSSHLRSNGCGTGSSSLLSQYSRSNSARSPFNVRTHTTNRVNGSTCQHTDQQGELARDEMSADIRRHHYIEMLPTQVESKGGSKSVCTNSRQVAAPVFVRELHDTNATEGHSVCIDASVFCSEPYIVQWFRPTDKLPLPNCADFRQYKLAGGTHVLTIGDSYVQDGGRFTCRVVASCGISRSSHCRLIVNESSEVTSSGDLENISLTSGHKMAPHVSNPAVTVSVLPGDSVCFWLRRRQSSRVSWNLDDNTGGEHLLHSKRSQIVCEETTERLEITDLQPDDSCCVRVHVVSSLFSWSGCVDLCVEAGLGRQLGQSDDSAHSSRISSATDFGDEPNTLSAVCSDVATDCSVDANDSSGNVTEIIAAPSNISVLVGETATLQCRFSVRGRCSDGFTPDICWSRSGRKLVSNKRLVIGCAADVTTLTIHDVTSDDSGKYAVCVDGQQCCASLSVEGRPEPPPCPPQLEPSLDGKFVTISWSGSAFDGGSVIIGYRLEAATLVSNSSQPQLSPAADDGGCWTQLGSDCCGSMSLSVPATSFQPQPSAAAAAGAAVVTWLRVRAVNKHGAGVPSEPGCLHWPASPGSDTTDAPHCPLAAKTATNGGHLDDDEVPAPFEHRLVTIEKCDNFNQLFDVQEELGKGRFGTVYKVTDKSNGGRYAAKYIKCVRSTDRGKVEDEVCIMNELLHPRLLQLAAAYHSGKFMIMLLEYVSGGELFERVVADDFTLTEHECALFMQQICSGVQYMHQVNIMHLDLKPENILCVTPRSHHIKIIDFGLARRYDRARPQHAMLGTAEFVAPEIINYEPISPGSDMWSLGVICYILLSGLSPFMGDTDAETFVNITRSDYDFEDDAFVNVSSSAKDFISQLLVHNQTGRMNACEASEHEWVAAGQTRLKNTVISKEKLKTFLIRRKWHKTGNAIRALGRMSARLPQRRISSTASSLQLVKQASSCSAYSERRDSGFSEQSNCSGRRTSLLGPPTLTEEVEPVE